MRKIYLLLILVISTFDFISAQTIIDNRKYIEVTGSADMAVQPDEIELEIILLEYDLEDKKIKLDDIESDFYKVLKKNNIDVKSIALDSSGEFYWWYWWSYYRSLHYQTKTIKLNLSKETNFLQLVEDLNQKWVSSIRIVKSSHKNIQQYRKEVKIEAIKAAKEKANYLLESIGEKVGSVLSVEELPENSYNSYWYNQSNLISNASVSNSSSGNDEIQNVSSIKLRYEIKVKFSVE